MASVTRFERLTLSNWRQFRDVDIQFHPQMSVLTGANGSGKTTVLGILGRHFGWTTSLVSTPRITRKGLRKYFSGIFDRDDTDGQNEQSIGSIHYTNGQVSQLSVPYEVSESFKVTMRPTRSMPGIFLTSHRPVYSYQKVSQIPTELNAREQLFDSYVQNMRQMYQPKARLESPSYRLKSSLISLATFGYGNEVVQRNEEAVETFEGFEKTLRSVLPAVLGFQRLAVRMPDVVLECESGDFSLDAASGGVAALIDIAWQIYMKSLINPDGFVVLMDEPENHLHPELQRSVLLGLIEAFENAQFIVATHNPFVVTSVRDSWVYVLDFIDNRVTSQPLHESDRSGTANETLRQVLGVPVPAPLWVEKELQAIVERWASRELSVENLQHLRREMADVGLGDVFPEAVDRILPKDSGA